MAGRAWPLLFVLVATPLSGRAQVRMGPEFQANTHTTGRQRNQDVATDAAGNFVVVWQSGDQDGSGEGVFARWYDAAGGALGTGDVRVNGHTVDGQTLPAVASTPDGRVVVAWRSAGEDGSGAGIYARQYPSADAPPGAPFRVNVYTSGNQSAPSVAADDAGTFVIVWQSAGQDGSGNAVVGRRFDALGQPRGGEFQVNTYTYGNQGGPAVASDAAGNFTVVWGNSPSQYVGSHTFARRYDATGAPLGEVFPVTGSFPAFAYQGSATVASDAAGNIVVAWSEIRGTAHDVWGQRYDAAGAARGGPFQVSARTTGWQSHPTVAMQPDGRFVVAWSDETDGSESGVFGRRYDALGDPEGGDFRVNTYVTGDQREPAVALDARGDFVVAWKGASLDGLDDGVFAQRFKPDLIFRNGFEDGTLDAWAASATDGGDLSVATAAAQKSSTAGLRGTVDDTAGIFVQDDRPDGERRYRGRFYFDPNDFDPGEAGNRYRTRIFLAFSEAPARRVMAIVLRRQHGQYSIRARARQDDDSQADTPFIPITDGPHVVEFDLRQGSFVLWVDDEVVSVLVPDNGLAEVDFVRMGALSVKAGASGTMYWDEFESRRQGAIGP